MYGKKPLIAILSALVLTGCGGGGSKDESSTGTIPHTTSKNSIASSTSGGDAQDEAAYKKLKSYVEFLDDGEHNPGYRSWSRYYFPVDYFEMLDLRASLENKKFTYDGDWYESTSQTILPDFIMEAKASIYYHNSMYGRSGYYIGLHMFAHPYIVSDDTLFGSLFSPISEESFYRVYLGASYEDNLTAQFDNITDTLKKDGFNCVGTYDVRVDCDKPAADYIYSLFFSAGFIDASTFVSGVSIQLEKQL